MDQIFHMSSVNSGRRAALYSAGGRVFFVWLPPFRGHERGGPALVLADDYQSGLDSCLVGEDISFVYMNRRGDLVCRDIRVDSLRPRLWEGRERLRVQRQQGVQIRCPRFFPAGDRTGIVYIEEDMEKEKYCLMAHLPDSEMARTLLERRDPFEYELVDRSRMRVIPSPEAASGETGSVKADQEPRGEWMHWDGKGLQRLPTLREEAERGRVEGRKEAEVYFEKEMDKRVQELKRQCSAQAENAYRQYEELAQVTRQLQEAGRKWREMYFEEI